MEKAAVATAIKESNSFTDVLYLTNNGQMPPEIKQLFKQNKASFLMLPVGKFSEVSDRLESVGTVVIDTKGLGFSQRQELVRIVESLDTKNIGVILLNRRIRVPVKSFSVAGPSTKSFSLVNTTESISIDELWVRINVNLVYRKTHLGLAGDSPNSPQQVPSVHSDSLTEQLHMAEAFVDNLAGQLRMAGLVQRDFLPTQIPDDKHLQWSTIFLPAEWVSGDIYDVVRIDEQHIGFYVADVVGHGVPAALLTIFLKQAMVLRETTGNNYRIFPPAEVMAHLNKRMTGQKLSGYQFATCCYCLLNVKTLQLTYARAGHPYPILLRPGEPPQQLEMRGALLGIFEQSEYVQQTVQLKQGDKLLLFSDGAEPFIGSFNDTSGFSFRKEFCELNNLPIAELMEKFNLILQNQKMDHSEVDDITVIGLEIL